MQAFDLSGVECVVDWLWVKVAREKIFFEGIQLRSKVILLTSLSERPLLKLRLKKVAKNRPKSLKLGDFLVD